MSAPVRYDVAAPVIAGLPTWLAARSRLGRDLCAVVAHAGGPEHFTNVELGALVRVLAADHANKEHAS